MTTRPSDRPGENCWYCPGCGADNYRAAHLPDHCRRCPHPGPDYPPSPAEPYPPRTIEIEAEEMEAAAFTKLLGGPIDGPIFFDSEGGFRLGPTAN